ncbi:sphingomyelin phosphodiesterase [Flavobacterium davisii]|uniref:Sphingomyelin phosphodiesterase n=1 Tax=Flavobacterium columnare TaxID=996 RepID=A0A8G0KV87_9FLAO|nr:sphingomyelin phosphodiesterase [Flavobacterium davisii]QYS88384.1 sphingomyelin phosphodiesterase [Flavobacterium davisii]
MKKLLLLLGLLLIGSCSDENVLLLENNKNSTKRLTDSSETFSVMSYNVYQLPNVMTQYKSKERAIELQKYISNLGTETPDVLVIEEGFNARFGDEFLAKVKTIYPYMSSLLGLYCTSGKGTSLYPNDWDGYYGDCGNTLFHINGGIIILSKYPILKKYQMIFKNRINSPEGLTNRGVAYVVIQKNGKKYHVMGTHTASEQPGFPGRLTREKQFNEMKTFKETFSIPRTEPVIYAGDMNVEYTLTDEYQKMKTILNGVNNYLFNPLIDRGTYSNQNTIVKYRGFKDYNNTLDYILLDKNHKLPEYITPTNRLMAQYFGGDISDHDPVYAKFVFTY